MGENEWLKIAATNLTMAYFFANGGRSAQEAVTAPSTPGEVTKEKVFDMYKKFHTLLENEEMLDR